MHFCEFLFIASSCNILTCHSSTEHEKDEVILENPEISKGDKLTINFGDVAIEVIPPRGSENILSTTEPIYEKWKHPDDVAYWDAIYGNMGDIPALKDLPEINGDTSGEDKITKENVSFKKHPDDYEKNDYNSSARKLSREAKSNKLSKDRCKWTNPLLSLENPLKRPKRETKNAEKQDESLIPKVQSSDEKSSLHQDELARSRRKVGFHSDLNPDYLYHKYGRSQNRGHPYERDPWIYSDQDIEPRTSEKFIDSRITKDSLVSLKSAVVNTGQAVLEAVKELAEAKDKVINLELETARSLSTKCLDNEAPTDCRKKRPNEEVNIGSDIEVVGKSRIATPRLGNIETSNPVGTERIFDRVRKLNVESIGDEVVENEIFTMEKVPEIDKNKSKIVIQSEKLLTGERMMKNADLESNFETIEGTELMSEKSFGKKKSASSKLKVKTDTAIHTTTTTMTVDDETSSGLKTNIEIEKNHKHENSRGHAKRHDSSCYCTRSGEERCNHEEEEEEEEDEGRYCRRRFPPRGIYRLNHKDHYKDHNFGIHDKTSQNIETSLDVESSKISEIHAKADRTSLNAGVDISSNFGPEEIDAEPKSSLELQSSVDILSRRGDEKDESDDYDNVSTSYNDEISSAEGTCDYDAEEYRKYKRRFPYYDHYGTSSRAYQEKHSAIRAGVQKSVNAKDKIESNAGGKTYLVREMSMNVDTDSDQNDDDKRYETDDDDARTGYETDYDDERGYRRTYEGFRDGEQYGAHQAIISDVYNHNGILSSLDAEVDSSIVGKHEIGAKSSLEVDSRMNFEGQKLNDNMANPLYHSGSINSRLRDNSEINSFIDAGVNLNDQSSLDINSNFDSKSSSFIADGNSRLDVNNRGENIPTSGEHCEAPYMCDECRKRLWGGLDAPSPICERPSDQSDQQRSFLSTGTIYHFNNSGLAEVQSGPIETFTESKGCCKRYINLDLNCTDEGSQENSECQDECVFRTPRDGNSVPLDFVRTLLSHGHDLARDMHDRARSLAAGGLHPSPHTASMLNFFHNKARDALVRLNEESELTLFGTKLLQYKLSTEYNITPNTFLEFLNHHGFRIKCMRLCRDTHKKKCNAYGKFRSLNGSCNNIAYPTWGQSNTAFGRILPPRYSDGIHGIPNSVTNTELPNARRLSVQFYSRGSNYDPELTLAVMQWGQTLAHDLARQVMDQTTQGGIECCEDNGQSQLAKIFQHHACAPISISPTDHFYSSWGQRCMNFVRAMTVPKEDCTLGPADQLNGATSFLDCSPMYGADKSTCDELREFKGGRMKVEYRNGRWLLPTTKNHSNFCDILTSDDICYRSGDPRTNQNPQLVILQTLLVREHNRVAEGLSALNPNWNDERTFQETRRIVIAEYQHITYNEWLPLLLGNGYATRYGLIKINGEMSNDYKENVNPSTLIGFTSGAFRSLHSMVDGHIGLCDIQRKYVETIRMSDHYFRPKVIEKDNQFERLLRGLVTQPMQMQDMNIHSELTEYLFRSRNDYGMDLAAIDIQRGRDHGMPGYNAYRKICRLEPADDFDDLYEEISLDNIEKLRREYAHVDDIDLIVGASMEKRSPGSHFGPTNLCIISEQFYRSRVGDRYFYDNANFPHSFTTEQFYEITKVRLSRLICDMGGVAGVIQPNAFRAVSLENRLVACEDLPQMDLTKWKE